MRGSANPITPFVDEHPLTLPLSYDDFVQQTRDMERDRAANSTMQSRSGPHSTLSQTTTPDRQSTALSRIPINPRSSLRQRQPGGTQTTGFVAGSASLAPPIQSNTNARASHTPGLQYRRMSTIASGRSYTGRPGFTDLLSRHTAQTPINRLLYEIHLLLGEVRDEVESYAVDDPAAGLARHIARYHGSLDERVQDLSREIQSMSDDALPPPYSPEDPITAFRNNQSGIPRSPSGTTRNHDAGQVSTPVTAVRRNGTRTSEARLLTASQLHDPRILAVDIEELNRRLRFTEDEFIEEILSEEEAYVDAAEERDIGVAW